MNQSTSKPSPNKDFNEDPVEECNVLLERDPLAPGFLWDLKDLFERIKFRPQILIPLANRVFAKIKSVDFPKKTKQYSLLLDIFLMVRGRHAQPWRNFTDFMDWWGFENFRDEDFMPIELHNGNFMRSLAERAYTRYYKALTSKYHLGECEDSLLVDFLAKLKNLSGSNLEYPYLQYHITQLLLLLGKKDEAHLTILPLVRHRQRDFWIWDALADTVSDPEMALACCCKGLLCRTDPKFLVKLRVKAAQLMHQLGFDGNAKCEIREWHKVYDRYGWRIPMEVVKIVKSDWYQNALPPMSNRDFYITNAAVCDNLIFSNMPEQPILITGINTAKGIVNYMTADRRLGFFFNRGIKTNFTTNTVYLARIEEPEAPGRASQLLTHRKETDLSPYIDIFFRQFSGELRIYQNGAYGFVEDVYINGRHIHPSMTPGQNMCGTASLCFNFKKQDFNWIALSLCDNFV